jgi:hypothetical protein
MDIVSFYTRDGAYPQFAEILRASCARFNIPCHIDELPPREDWVAAIGLKPGFLYRKLMEFKRPIVWCDIDCEIIEYPTLLEQPGYDVMFYDWNADPMTHFGQLNLDYSFPASGVMYLAYTPETLQLLYKWKAACEKDPQTRDDEQLAWLFKAKKAPKLRIFPLPKPYNRMDRHWEQVKPVINHVFRDGAIRYQTDTAPQPYKPRAL